ncbi:MAG: hypothetical protein NT159_00015 [Proteobacteria bacterium]|nr:hypothetical protein [Pseudomonadota bacterium]
MPWTTETLLKAIGAAKPTECFTEAHMVAATGLTAVQIERSALNLRKHGFITRTAKGCHKLTDAGRKAVEEGASLRSGPKGPQQSGQRIRDRGLRQRVWNALRLSKKLTVDDIVMRVVDGHERDPVSNVRKYVRALERAGYVRCMATREPKLSLTSNGCKRWLLIKDTGPDAPVWRAKRANQTLYDPNLEREVPLDQEPTA